MKTLKLIAIGIILLLSSSIQAQVSVSLNIGTPPSWGPSGYAHVDYYYLPDVHAYYDIQASQFIYFGNGNWVRSRYLPRQYRNYDLYSGYKVVLNGYHGNRPYAHFNNHRVRYNDGYRYRNQRSIGQRNDNHRYADHHRYAKNDRRSNDYRYAKNHRRSNDHRKYDNHSRNDKHNKYENKRDHGNNGHGRH